MALMSAKMVERSVRRSSVNCAASSEPVSLTSSSVGMDVAVVSHRPGSCGDIRFGRTEVDVGMGICSDKDKGGVKLMWAIRELERLLYKVDIAFARLDWDSNFWYKGAKGCFGPKHVRFKLFEACAYTVLPLYLLRTEIAEASLAV